MASNALNATGKAWLLRAEPKLSGVIGADAAELSFWIIA
jgi:hypothetical protein